MKKMIGFAAIALFAVGCSGSGSTTGGSSGGSNGGTSGSSCNPGTTVTNPTIDPGCGSVSVQGSCSGSTVTFCQQGDFDDGGTGPVSVDCSTIAQGDPSITCGFVDQNVGYTCLSEPGTECAFSDPNSGGLIVNLCQGGCGTGCDLNTGKCATGVTACSALPDGGQRAPACDGNKLQIQCQEFQPAFVDCAALGGGCSLGQCTNLPAGAPCDPPGTQGALFVCASGHTCAPVDGGNACQ